MESAPVNTPVKDQQVKNMPVKDATGKVDMVVQEYMDSLLGDLFPSIEPEPVVAPPVVSLSLNTEIRDAEPIIAEPIETKPSEVKPAEISVAESKTIAAVKPAVIFFFICLSTKNHYYSSTSIFCFFRSPKCIQVYSLLFWPR